MQLGKDRMDDVVGGLSPPEPPAFVFFSIFDLVCLKPALFPSTPRELSLPPLDRARRCDSFAPNESYVAQFQASFRARAVKLI